MRVLSGFDMTISMFDDLGSLDAQLAHLKRQHDAMQIPGVYFQVFGRGMLQVMKARVGRCFSEEAFRDCYEKITAGLLG